LADKNKMPLCFSDPADWRLWVGTRGTKHNDSEYCTDCTPDHQKRMIAAARCQHPGTLFHLDGEGELRGVRPGCGSGMGGPGNRRADGDS
jgi:hypothetical protein